MRRLTLIFAIGVSILTTIMIVFLYSTQQGVFEANFVSAVITSMLVFVTAVSVFMTLLLLRENRTARQKEYEPAFSLSLKSIFSGTRSIVIENIGNGPAQDVDVTLTVKPNDMEYEMKRKNVRPGDGFLNLRSEIPVNPEEAEKVVIDGECKDVFGNKVEIYSESDVDILRTAEEDSFLRDENEKLRRELNSIDKSIKSIFDDVEMQEINTFIRRKNSQAVIECFQEHGDLTWAELVKLMGVQDVDLLQTIIWLESANSIEYECGNITDLSADTEFKLLD